MYRSHQGQDQWVIERVFSGKRGGWFIDSGAGPDGIRGSNSYVLETEFAWRGLLVEPHPEFYKRVNRSAIVEECCFVDSPGEVEFVLRRGVASRSTSPSQTSWPRVMPTNNSQRFASLALPCGSFCVVTAPPCD
jgi:hypothetical protein